MRNKKLYFLALIPSEPLRKQVYALKEEFSKLYHTSHALKSPPHVTLVPPFSFEHQNEHLLTSTLHGFARLCSSFEVSIADYGAFKPRVIYLSIIRNDRLELLQQMLMDNCNKDLGINMDQSLPFHPHMTVAFRDLSPQMFRKAWERYKSESFSTSFIAKSLFLLKHNGEKWDIAHELPFAEPTLPS